MGSLTFGGIQFVVYSNDHPPRHVHGFLSETETIVDLRLDGNVRPGNAKRSDVRKILEAAAGHFTELVALWESIRL